MSEKITFKQRLYSVSKKILDERIDANQAAIDAAQASANEEEKSSAGDKYETSRAMSHLEKDMYTKQLASNKNEMAALLSIDCSRTYESVVPGAVIKCSGCSFFIAAGLGKLIFEEEEVVYFLSPYAPLAKLLFTKKQGDIIQFNNTDLIIIDIY
jgi:hypothetical protein